MTTTIYPVPDGGPDDDGLGPRFPSSTGMGMLAQFREAALKFPKPEKSPKKIISDAEGSRTAGPKARLKTSKKPENLRKGKKKKLGPFGESYSKPPGSNGKGVRVAESRRRTFETMRESFRRRFKAWRRSIGREALEDEDEVAPPGREEQVKKLKRQKGIDNPWAVAWASYNKDKD